jgi:hypothetical protein
MTDNSLKLIRNIVAPSAISIIAQAEARRAGLSLADLQVDSGSLDLPAKAQSFAPKGVVTALDAALEQAHLPSAFVLSEALSFAAEHVVALQSEDVFIDVALKVVEDEQRKLARFLELRSQ